MQNDSAEILDDLLIRWHQMTRGRVGRGYDTKSSVFGGSLTSKQYDDQNGALDADLELRQVQAVDFAVSEMRDPYRAGIYANARALVYGCEVFSSARLPEEREAKGKVIKQARGMLTNRLVALGVM